MRKEDNFVDCAACMYPICVTTCVEQIEENLYCPDCVDAVMNEAINAEKVNTTGATSA